jgi:replicative DNA helicase
MTDFTPDLSLNALPPQNIDAEEIILGGILFDSNAMGKIVDLLPSHAFYVPANRQIYEAARTLFFQGKPIDLMTVSTWLNDNNLLDKIGGIPKLAQLVDRTVSSANIENYVPLVMNKYLRRLLINSGHEIAELGFDTTQELDNILDLAEQKIFSLTQTRNLQGLKPISDTLINTFTEIEKLHQKIANPGITCGFYDLDNYTSGFQRSDLIIIAGRPSMGKCLAANSEIVLDDGSIATIEEIYTNRQGKLLTLQNNGKFTFTQPSNFIDDGIKPVFRLTTKLGKTIETTIIHPFLTIQGWRKLSELKLGDKIAIPRQLNIFGKETIPDYQVKLLAYFTSDLFLTNTSPQFSNSYPSLENDFIQSASKFLGIKINKETWQSHKNNIVICLKKSGIWDENYHKKNIPKIIFRLHRSLISLFINRLFAIDGSISVLKNSEIKFIYRTVIKKLAYQIQHLLLRFGIISHLQKKSFIHKNTLEKLWVIEIKEPDSISIFIEEINIFGKEEEINLAKEAFLTLENLSLQQLAKSQVYWDKVISIEYMGEQQVYDLTIPQTHNFVANDICVHNTSFALNIAANVAKEHNSTVAIFSLEMSREQLAMRLLAGEARIESNKLRSGRITENEMTPLMEGMDRLSQLPIYIDDTANISVMQIRSEVRRLQAEKKGNLGLVLLDYLQLMEGGKSDNRVQELSRITRSLKGLARELNVPLIALSQLSRGVEQRTNKRPMLSDLRESGSIEQDADLVLMLYRDEYYNPDSVDRGISEVIIAKHRNGPTGQIKLLFRPELTQFLNLQK